jgi:hypothetical protein
VFYLVDNAGVGGSSSQVLFIENDSTQPAVGVFRQQEQ